MRINNYTDNLLINNLSQKNRSINNAQKSLNALTSLSSYNNVGSVIKDIKMTKIESEVRGTVQGSKNIQDGVSLIQTATNGLESMTIIGEKIREIAVKYNNDTLNEEQKIALEEEAKIYYKELGEILNNTHFNNQKIFEKNEYVIQTGAYSDNKYTINFNNIGTHFKDIFDKMQNELDKPSKKPENPYIPPNNNIESDNSNDNDINTGDGSIGNDNVNNDNVNNDNVNNDNVNNDNVNNDNVNNDNNINNGNNVNGDNNLYNNSTNNFDNYLDYIIKETTNIIKNKEDGWHETVGENGWKVQCEVIDGKLEQYVKVYNEKNECIMEAHFSKGEINGFANIYKDNKLIGSGDFTSDRKIDSWGTITYDDGSKYTGDLINGVKNGWGTYTDIDGKETVGVWEDDKYIKYESTKPIDNLLIAKNINLNNQKSNELNIDDLLNLDFIDKSILSPIKSTTNSLLAQENILAIRHDINNNKVNIYDSYISDKANSQYISLTNQLRADKETAQLISMLYSDTLDQRRDSILKLLYN